MTDPEALNIWMHTQEGAGWARRAGTFQCPLAGAQPSVSSEWLCLASGLLPISIESCPSENSMSPTSRYSPWSREGQPEPWSQAHQPPDTACLAQISSVTLQPAPLRIPPWNMRLFQIVLEPGPERSLNG